MLFAIFCQSEYSAVMKTITKAKIKKEKTGRLKNLQKTVKS